MDISNVLKLRRPVKIYMFLYHLLKGKHVDSDCHDFLANFFQHIYGKTVKMHFVGLFIYDAGWTTYFPKLLFIRTEYCPNLKSTSQAP